MLRLFGAVVACIFVFSLVGCGVSHVPVAGKVTVDGAPLDTGNVSYHPAAAGAGGMIGSSEIASDGSYKIMAEGKAGLAPGKYKVTVTAGKPSNPSDPYSVPVSLVDAKYTNLASTPLEVDVSAGDAAGKYDLKVTK
jgi:hypothetical protein